MLLVKTKLGASSIHGIGVLADEFIPAGTKIGEWRDDFDQMFHIEDLWRLPQVALETVKWHAYLHDECYFLNADNMRFFNHSSTPNTRQDGFDDYAVRDINPGEELTCDYFSFDDDADAKLGFSV